MQFGKTIIVTLVAALTLAFAPKANAFDFADFVCAAIGAAGGGSIGYQMGQGQGKTAATIAGAGIGTLIGLGVCNAVRDAQAEKYRATYNTKVSSCIKYNEGCTQNEFSSETRLLKTGNWKKDNRFVCRCYAIYVDDGQGGKAKVPYCVGQYMDQWVKVDSKDVQDSGKTSLTDEDYRRLDERYWNRKSEEWGLGSTGTRDCPTCRANSGSSGMSSSNGIIGCTGHMPAGYREDRNVYIDDRCQVYSDGDGPYRFADGTVGTGALQACQEAIRKGNDYGIKTCRPIVIDHNPIL